MMKNLLIHSFLLPLTLIVLFSCTVNRENPEITSSELAGHISFLASDSLKGRFPGTPEDSVAALYIAGEFKKAGLKSVTENGLQPFEINTDLGYGKNNYLDAGNYQGTILVDFVPFSFSSDNELDAEVIFAGYGFDIDKGDLRWNDYRDIDVSGKWVLLLRGHPETDSSSSVFDNYGNDRDKVMTAKDLGASGVLFVSGVSYDPEDKLVTLKNREFSTGIPVIQVKRSLSDRFLKESGVTTDELEKELITGRHPHSFHTGASVKASVDLVVKKDTTYNVTGYLQGHDPVLRDQWIILGAHYDHLGYGGPGSSSRQPDTNAIHYGADDNASGVSAMIEIAEKLALEGPALPCSYQFVAFGAEEMGLLGSKYFMDHLSILPQHIRMMINLDMIGRLKSRLLQVGGTGTAVETDSLLDDLLKKDSIKITRNPEGSGPSDHASFYAKDIPVLFITSGPHSDYHTPNDRPDSIDLNGMLTISEFIYNLMIQVGRFDSLLTFREAGPKVMPDWKYGRTRVTLGIMPDFMDSDDHVGMRVDMVSPGRPAALGGMKKGDYIIAIEGKPVENVYDYMYRLSHVEPGRQIVVTVMRNEEKIDLLIQI